MSDLCDDLVEILRERFPAETDQKLNAAAGYIYGHLSKHFDNYAEALRASAEPKHTVCWVAYYTDMSAVAVFNNELDALRHAVGTSMYVIEAKAGDVMDQINAQYRKES